LEPEHLLPLDTVYSVCPHDCPSACALAIERIDGSRIGRVHGAEGQSYTRGIVCAKVARYAERQHHPERLSVPLRRVGEKGRGRDAFVPISWDEALDEVAEQLTLATQRYGSESVWPHFYAGTMGRVQRDCIERFRHVLRYSRQHSTICNALTDAGWFAGLGAMRGIDGCEIGQSDLIVIWGGNPVSTQINVMKHVAEARHRRAAKLVVVDPRRTGTAAIADLHLAPLPGTDGALACAVMHVLFAEDYADRDYMAKYTDDPAGLETHLAGRGPEWAARITGLGLARLRRGLVWKLTGTEGRYEVVKGLTELRYGFQGFVRERLPTQGLLAGPPSTNEDLSRRERVSGRLDPRARLDLIHLDELDALRKAPDEPSALIPLPVVSNALTRRPAGRHPHREPSIGGPYQDGRTSTAVLEEERQEPVGTPGIDATDRDPR
jgi:hypothetical protein